MNELPIEIIQKILDTVLLVDNFYWTGGTLGNIKKCGQCIWSTKKCKCKHVNKPEMRCIQRIMLVCSLWNNIIKSKGIKRFR